MGRIYIAVNGDDVGSKIGDAVASNDHMALGKISSSLKDSHSMIEDWVQGKGGEVITSSGDEGIYILPEECLAELEQIRSQYQQMSGHTLTVGVGSSMSDASKALIYGKLNEKNQVVHYEPAIDDMLSDDQVQEAEQATQAAPENQAPQQQAPQQQAPQQGMLIPETQQKEVLNESQMNAANEVPLAKEPLDTGDTQDFSDTDDSIEGAGNEVGESNENEMNPNSDEYDKTDPQQAVEQVMVQEQGSEQNQPEGQELGEEQPMNPQEETEEDAIEGQMDDMDSDNIEHDAEPNNEDEDALVDMVHQDMDDAGEGYGDENPEDYGDENPEDEMNPGDDQMMGEEEIQDEHADIKSAIMDTLQIFRTHKPDLDMLATANPELHAGLISMLQNMIEMGKRLQNDNIDDGSEDGEDLDQFANEFPEAGDNDEDGDVDADDEALEDDQELGDEDSGDIEDQEEVEEGIDEHNEDMHGEDPNEDSAISDDDSDEDATPENNDDDQEKPSFPPKKDGKEKLEKK